MLVLLLQDKGSFFKFPSYTSIPLYLVTYQLVIFYLRYGKSQSSVKIFICSYKLDVCYYCNLVPIWLLHLHVVFLILFDLSSNLIYPMLKISSDNLVVTVFYILYIEGDM